MDPQLDYNYLEEDRDLDIIINALMPRLNLTQIPILFLKNEELLLYRDPQFLQLYIRKIIEIQDEAQLKEDQAKKPKKGKLSMD